MALQEDGFTTPAIKRCTSDARRLSESSTLAQKCSKHIMFLMILWYEHLRAKIRKPKNTNLPPIFAFTKVSVWLESGVNFKKRAKTRFQKCARRLGESATTKQPIPRLTRRWGESSVFNIYVAKVYENTVRNEHRSFSVQHQYFFKKQ